MPKKIMCIIKVENGCELKFFNSIPEVEAFRTKFCYKIKELTVFEQITLEEYIGGLNG